MLGFKIPIPIVIFFLSLNIYAQDPPKNNRERKAVQMVECLKEVKKAKKYFSTTRHPLHVYIDGKDGHSYLVRAAQFIGERTFTCYVFWVDPRKNIIKYWDIPADTIISIPGWRRDNYEIDHSERKKRSH